MKDEMLSQYSGEFSSVLSPFKKKLFERLERISTKSTPLSSTTEIRKPNAEISNMWNPKQTQKEKK